jgi:undecaprenyl diphosphate synthase
MLELEYYLLVCIRISFVFNLFWFLDLSRLPRQAQNSVADLETATASCTGFQLNICLSYGSRQEIIDACRTLANDVAAGHISSQDINEESFQARLVTHGIPGKLSIIFGTY